MSDQEPQDPLHDALDRYAMSGIEPGTFTDSESLGIPPSIEAEAVKEAARIDPTTGRLPEDELDPMCDHCDERPWTIILSFKGMDPDRSRKLCLRCTGAILVWI